MWNQDEYTRTLLFAAKAHCNQKVPGAEANYTAHFTNVAMEVAYAVVNSPDSDIDGTFAIQVALLHDTIEDTDVEYADLVAEFGKKVADAVLTLTKNEDLPTKEAQMKDSLARIKENSAEARVVKMADRINNLQKPPHFWKTDKMKRYQAEARLILEELRGVNDFIENRLEKKIADYEQYF